MMRLMTIAGISPGTARAHCDYAVDMLGSDVLRQAIKKLGYPGDGSAKYNLYLEVPGSGHLFYFPPSETLRSSGASDAMTLHVIETRDFRDISAQPFRIPLSLASKIRTRDDFTEMTSLWAGGQARIYRATEKSTGKTVAIKKYISSDRTSPEMLRSWEREVRISADVEHPALASSQFIFHRHGVFSPILKFYPNGSLADLRETALTPTQSMIAMYGIANGMAYLHALQITHRDLKPGNVLLSGKFHPKIIDFGLSRDMTASCGRCSLVEATLRYMAPEQLDADAEQNTFLSDVHSFGMVVWTVLAREEPWRPANCWVPCDARGLMAKIKSRVWPAVEHLNVPHSLKDLMTHCWDLPRRRPTFPEICGVLEEARSFLDGTDVDEYMKYIRKLKAFWADRKVEIALQLPNRQPQRYCCTVAATFGQIGMELARKCRLAVDPCPFSFFSSDLDDADQLEGPVWRYRHGQVIHVRVDTHRKTVQIVADSGCRDISVPQIMTVEHIRMTVANVWGIDERSLELWTHVGHVRDHCQTFPTKIRIERT
jgi:serine/threonine protein kinase